MDLELQSLLNLQEKDLAAQEVENELAGLLPELEQLERELAEVESALEAAQVALKQAGSRRQELEGKIEGYKLMQDRKRQKLEWVRGAKEASEIMAELDLARSVLAREEADWVRSADRVLEAEARATETQSVVDEVKEAQAPKREEILAKQSEYQIKLDVAQSECDKAKQSVPKPFLSKYERILKGNAPMVLFALRGGACGNCFTAVPMHLRQQIEHAGAIVNCQACGVMVYAIAE